MTPEDAVRIVREQTIPALAASGGGGHVEALTVLVGLLDGHGMRAHRCCDEVVSAEARERALREFVQEIESDADSGGIGSLSPQGKLFMRREQARRLLYALQPAKGGER